MPHGVGYMWSLSLQPPGGFAQTAPTQSPGPMCQLLTPPNPHPPRPQTQATRPVAPSPSPRPCFLAAPPLMEPRTSLEPLRNLDQHPHHPCSPRGPSCLETTGACPGWIPLNSPQGPAGHSPAGGSQSHTHGHGSRLLRKGDPKGATEFDRPAASWDQEKAQTDKTQHLSLGAVCASNARTRRVPGSSQAPRRTGELPSALP